MISLDPYAILVDFYDEWSAHMTDDVPFYVKKAGEVPGPIVELGVGHGRVAIPVAQAGQHVIGVDVSDAMLAEGRRRAAAAGVADRVSFLEGDMRTFVAEPPVHLVTIPFRAFGHLLTVEDQLAALTRVHRSLVPGGRLVFNLFTPDPQIVVALDRQRKLQAEFTDERGRRCQVHAIPEYSVAEQIVRVRAIFEVYEADRLLGSTETVLELRMMYQYEVRHLLERAGFEVEALYGGFDERPYGPGPDEMVWVARKP